MPTTIADGETYPEALQRRYAEESKAEEHMTTKLEQAPDGYALISIDALKAWGKYDEVRNACQFPAEQAEQDPVAWVDGSTHYQPKQKAFYKRVSATEWYIWGRIEQGPLHWCKSLGTSDSAHWILRQPAQPVKQEPFMCEPVPPISEDGWTDWVCPKPQGYLMQCCDCGLIHEVDSRVAMYQPMPSEEFEVVENPNMQCQWRVRRRDDLRESNVKV